MNNDIPYAPDGFLRNNKVPKAILVLNVTFALFYFAMLAFYFQRGNVYLFTLLMIGEVYHLWQAITFIHTIWETERKAFSDPSYAPPVDVFITVAGEPVDIIEQTIIGAKNMRYPAFNIFVLNDGRVANKKNWAEVEALAERLRVNCITRTVPGGAKAGNINHALWLTNDPFIAVFDADHVPHEDFLQETVPYFADPGLAFLQTPQLYQNYELNDVTRGAWEQQTLFFGPICKGKNRMNAAPMCGTNMVIRREALEGVGGMCESSIAEDFITGFFLHKRGWRSYYLPKVLADGLAPEDFLSYYKQQSRWARGSLDLFFKFNLLFTRGITFAQRIQYLSSVTYFLSGWVVLIDAIIPMVFFFTGLFPVANSTMALAMIFLPYMSLMLYLVQRASNFSFSYRALAFSISGFQIHIAASLRSFFRKKTRFSVTAKRGREGNFLRLVIPQMLYIVLIIFAASYSLARSRGVITPAWVANAAWAFINGVIFFEYIRAASPETEAVQKERDIAQALVAQEKAGIVAR